MMQRSNEHVLNLKGTCRCSWLFVLVFMIWLETSPCEVTLDRLYPGFLLLLSLGNQRPRVEPVPNCGKSDWRGWWECQTVHHHPLFSGLKVHENHTCKGNYLNIMEVPNSQKFPQEIGMRAVQRICPEEACQMPLWKKNIPLDKIPSVQLHSVACWKRKKKKKSKQLFHWKLFVGSYKYSWSVVSSLGYPPLQCFHL